MKNKYKIEGLDCPNCAKTLENKINELDCIKTAKINFVKSTLEIESDNNETAIKEVINLAKKIEPDAKIIVNNDKYKILNKQFIIDICLLAVGIALGFVCIFVKMPNYIYWPLFVVSALLMGYKTYYKAVQLLFKKTINENMLVTISVVGAAVVGETMDALMVIALYSIGKILESLALNKTRKSIENLTNLKPEQVTSLVNGEEEVVSPSNIEVGDIIIVKPGERVAIDGIIIDGEANLDVQSLTGESLPKHTKTNDEILSGSIVLDSVLKIQATSKYENSTVYKILDMIENASEKKSKTETVISKMTKWYTLGVILLSILVWGIVWAVTKDINTSVYRGLIFLVVSCPCAFAISVPLAYFSGIGNASKKGILIKGSNYLDGAADLKTIAFDKTGTLTTGEFKITQITSLSEEKSEDEILHLCALGEKNSLHPLALAIVKNCNTGLENVESVKEVPGEGVYFEYANKNYFVGRKTQNLTDTTVELFENNEKIGEIKFEDTIKDSSIIACESLNKMGIQTVILSGDNEKIVNHVAGKIGINQAYSNLLPQDKFNWIENAKSDKKNKIGYVGDGLNDAPSLTLADVGFSMGLKGNAASIEASDIVLANDNPEKIVEAIKISRYTKKIVWENIALAAGVKLIFLSLGAFGVTGMLSAVIADVGVTLLAILNSLRALKYKAK